MRAIKTTTISILAIGLLAGSAVGVAAQEDAEEPVEFTATVEWDHQLSERVPGTNEAGYDTFVGGAWQFTFIETSDPRIDGTMTDSETQVVYPGGDAYPDGEFFLGAGAWRIENEGGAWQQTPSFRLGVPWPEGEGGTGDMVFVGEGGYEGYIALVQETDGQLRGVIVQDELPEVPEPYAAE